MSSANPTTKLDEFGTTPARNAVAQPVSDVSEPDLEDDEQTQRGHESPRKSGKVQGLPDKAAGGKLSWAQKLQAGGRSKADAVSPPSPAKQGVVQAQGETAEDAPTAAPTLAPAPQGKARRRQRTLSQTAEDEGPSDDGGGVFPTKRQPKVGSKASNPWQEKKLERERAQARASKHGAWAGRPEEAAGAIGNSSVPEREPNKAKQSKAAPNADLKATQAKTEAAEKAKQLVAPLPSFLKPETEKAPREEQRPEAAQSASASASAVALSLQSLDRDASPLSTPTSAPSSPASSRSSAKADHQPDASSANAERQVRQSTGTRNAHESEAARRPRTGQDGQREMPVGVPMPMMPMPMQMGMPMQGQMAMPMHPGAHQHGQMPAQAMWQGQPMHPQAAAQMHHFNAMQQQLFEQRLRCRQALEQQILFYFSADNIRGDKFLRTHMDADGFVKLSLIAGFRRIKALTSDMSLVAEAVLAHPDKMQLRMVDAPNASNSFPRLQEPLIRSVDPAVLAFVQNDRR